MMHLTLKTYMRDDAGEILRTIRNERGITQEWLSLSCHVSKSTIQKIETGVMPMSRRINFELFRYLEIDFNDDERPIRMSGSDFDMLLSKLNSLEAENARLADNYKYTKQALLEKRMELTDTKFMLSTAIELLEEEGIDTKEYDIKAVR